MAKAFKPTRGLNAFTLQYVNSQCQHDSLPLKLPAKLHLLAEPAKSPTDYFPIQFSICGLCILDFVSSMRLHGIIPLPSSRGPCVNTTKEGSPRRGVSLLYRFENCNSLLRFAVTVSTVFQPSDAYSLELLNGYRRNS